MSESRPRRRPMSEINVVPYIDVTLVLLVIFMVTTPLMTQSVEVQLPKQPPNTAVQEKPPSDDAQIKVEIDAAGAFFLTLGSGEREAVDEAGLQERTRAYLAEHTAAPVYVGGDENVPYRRVLEAMGLLSRAGATNVGLLSERRE